MTASATRMVYLHGFPGGPEELVGAVAAQSSVIAPDRRHDAPELGFGNYCDRLSASVAAQAGGAPVTLIGFSLGSRMALEIACRLGARVEHIILVSAVAPLDTGDFLRSMAGSPVFRAARFSPHSLAALTMVQRLMVRVAPDKLFDLMFANAAPGAEAALAQDRAFRRTVIAMLSASLNRGATGYRREVMAYVAPWDDLLPRVTAPVTLWHGDDENWAPPDMADVLAARLPNVCAVRRLPGQSHYSTLAMAMAQFDR